MEHFMTSEEIAELLHVDPVTIRRLVNKSELSAYRIGADYRFAPSDLQEYLQRQRIPAQAQVRATGGTSNPLDQIAQALRKAIRGKGITPSELATRFRQGQFELFTMRARRVLTLAQEEALRLRHGYIGTEHLLLGLVRENGGVASRALSNLGVEIDRVRQAVEAIVSPGTQAVEGEPELTPRTKKVIEFALDEARHLSHHFIGTEHLLLGLVREGEGVGADVLEDLGLQLEQVRVEILRMLDQRQGEPVEEAAVPSIPPQAATLLAEGEAGLTCTRCGAHSPGYFHYCFNCGQSLPHEEPSQDVEA